MDVVKICALCICVVFIAVQFKGGKAEYGIYLCTFLALLLLFASLARFAEVVERLEELKGYLGTQNLYLGTLVKVVVITYLSEFAGSLCKDAGYQSIAGQIEIFSKITILLLSVPVLVTLMETAVDFYGG
ncbi:MAG: SpoIIIAC/SpoIIIAD family protein [Lachnospiraceae bacterium]